MQPSNQLSKYAIFLALGFAMGLGAANFFAAGHNEGKATAPPPSATAKTPEAYALSTARNAPIKLAANLGPPTKDSKDSVDSVGDNALSEDISLSETVDTSGEESAATEPSPEELAENQPIDGMAAPPLSSQETDGLESKLRLESENTAPISLEGNEGLLGHERP